MAGKLSLTKVPSREARAEVVQGARDEFFARARLTEDKYGGIGGSDGLDLFQDPAQGSALPNDLREVLIGAGLLLQVDLLLVQFVLEGLDLAHGQGVLHCHSHLVGDLLQEVHVRLVVGAGLFAREHQHAQATPRRREGQFAEAVHPQRLRSFRNRGQRFSSATFETIRGRCVCKTLPAGLSSTYTKAGPVFETGSVVSRTCKRMVSLVASCRTQTK